MLQGLSANIKLPESHQDLSHALLAVSKRIFTNAQPVVLSLPVQYAIVVLSDRMNSERKYGQLLYTAIAQNSLCNPYNDSLNIAMYPPAHMSYALSRDYSLNFSNSFIEGVDTLLENLQTEGQWPVLVSPTSFISREGEYKNFIFTVNYKNNDFTDLEVDINYQLRFQYINMIQNPKGHFIVVVLGDPGTEKVAQNIFQYFFDNNHFDTAVILREPEVRFINVFYPSNFCVIPPRPTLLGIWIEDKEGERFLENADFNKEAIERNLTGCCFEVMNTESDPFVILDNKDYSPRKAKGLDVRLLEIFTKFVRASSKNCVENSVHITVRNNMAELYLHSPDSELTTPYFTRSYKFFVPIAQIYPRWASLTRVFTTLAWVSILVCIVFTSLISQALTSCMSVNDPNRYSGVVHNWLNTWCVILGVGVDKMPRSTCLRIFFLSWIIYSICVNTIFQAFFTSYMVDPGRQHQIDTLQEILDNNHTFLFHEVHTFLAYTSMYDIENRAFMTMPYINIMIIAFASEQNAVMMNEDFFTYYSKKLCGPTEPPVYHKFSGQAIQLHVQMIISGGRYLFFKFNQVLGRLVQAGVPRKLMSDIIDPLGHVTANRAAVDLSEEYVPLSLSIMQSPFLLLFLGLFVSVMVFLAEMTISYAQKSGLLLLWKV
ncbi:hypothetical protein ANN_00090 [Periplaneta americana]|uniref:Uncharacterized protein n=1 Tax=Periplaneta americana TaxID=6978 RepID=A0ABQ8TSK6_PERAM|nr:hypothetical protein ANN_00090 [Periplaneta americana]